VLHAFERIKDSRIHLPFHWQHLCWIILESWEHVSHFPLHNGLWTEAAATLATFELKRQSWRSNRFTTSTTSPMGGYGSSTRDIRPTDINRSWSVFVFVISTVSNPKCIEPKSAHQGCWNQLRVGMVTGWLPDGSVSHGVRSTAALPSIRCRNSQARGAEGSGSDHSARICKVYPGGVVLICPQWVVKSIKHPAKPCKALYMVLWKFVNSWVCVGSKVCGSKTRNFETDAPPQPDHAKG
jgi:hypothetical protein